GTSADTRWGPVQVQLTVSGGRITAVDVIEYPSGNHKDQEINADAIPTLVDETLTAQNANIDMVSGATVTSDGYRQSLQGALDEAGL
ncbi:MAG: FMN-binding protein, partial [Actinomycetes bacterium]